MIYKKYGEVFRKLRLQHHLLLSDFERVGLSKSTLSYFENGKSMISLDKLDLALQEMHTTFRSYMLMISNNREKLQTIYRKNIKYDMEENQVIALSAKACYTKLSPDEIKYIENKLKSYQVWHSYEMYILVNTLEEINPDLLYHLMERILSQNSQYLKEITEFRNLLIRLVIRTILSLIRREEKEFSERLVKELDKLMLVFDTYIRISSIFVKGCWIYKFEDKNMGMKLVSRTLKILSEIDALELREIFKHNFEQIK